MWRLSDAKGEEPLVGEIFVVEPPEGRRLCGEPKYDGNEVESKGRHRDPFFPEIAIRRAFRDTVGQVARWSTKKHTQDDNEPSDGLCDHLDQGS